MRLIWNAGAASVITAMLTSVASLGSDPRPPAHPGPAIAAPTVSLPHRHYASLSEHFQAANTSADGKLTLDQASHAGWSRVARHFDEIDLPHAGYVTEQQIHAYNLSHRHNPKAGGDV